MNGPVKRDPIGRLLAAGVFACLIVIAYDFAALAVANWLHYDRTSLGVPTQGGMRIGDFLTWLILTDWLYWRLGRKATAEQEVSGS